MEKTINIVFRNRVNQYKDRLAIEKKLNGRWESASWQEYYNQSRLTGLGLYDLGIQKGDHVSLLSDNRLEWLYTDMGTLGIGACLIPIYPTLTQKEVAFIVNHSDSKILVVENEMQLQKGLYALDHCQNLKTLIVIDLVDQNHASVLTFNHLVEKGVNQFKNNPNLFEELANSVQPEDLATIVYTSGTTGVPKGAMISHGNIMAVMHSLDQIEPKFANDKDHAVPFLPLSHVFERAAGHFYGMYKGITSSYAESINTILDDLKEKKPTIMLAVPRVCEKVYQRIISQVQEQPFWRQGIFYAGQYIGTWISSLREKKETPPFYLTLLYHAAYQLIFKKLHDALGGRLRWMTASGAPTSRDIVLFFNAAGITVVEGYGMTECFAPATMSNLADYKIGTVGKPLPGIDIKIAEDGEILIKGDNVFIGYWKLDEETRDAFTEDGYLKTGDIGKFDAQGFLMVTDRKKNILITSGGKNVAPQKIESLFMTDPIFTQFLVIGDRRKFLSALVTLNPEQSARLAEEEHISYDSLSDLYDHPQFIECLEKRIQEKNTELARYETIKKIRIIKHEFSQEAGELTPSLKIKRNVILKKYNQLIDSMYEE